MSSFLSYALFYTFFYLAFLPRGLCEGGGGGSSGNAYMYGGEGAKFTGLSLMTYRPLHNWIVMSSLYWISLFAWPILPGQSDISCFSLYNCRCRADWCGQQKRFVTVFAMIWIMLWVFLALKQSTRTLYRVAILLPSSGMSTWNREKHRLVFYIDDTKVSTCTQYLPSCSFPLRELEPVH